MNYLALTNPKKDHKLNASTYKAIKAVKPMFAGAPMLITRVDFGCCLKSSGPKEKRFFLNEIEFNPGMYLHADGQRKFNMDKKIAKQLVKVVKFNQLKAK